MFGPISFLANVAYEVLQDLFVFGFGFIMIILSSISDAALAVGL